MKLPKVSVIVPTYLEEDYIEGCLKSIKKQDYPEKIEIIVADSNSHDNTVKIAKKYADKIVVIKERGIAKGRNAGAKVATGEILVFVDADVRLKRNCISRIVKEFENKNVVGVCVPVYYYRANAWERFMIKSCYELVHLLLSFGKCMFPGICVAYRADAFKLVNGFDESMKFEEDLELSMRIAKLGKCICIKDVLGKSSPRRFRKSGAFFPFFVVIPPSIALLLGFKMRVKYPHVKEIKGRGLKIYLARK
jgi:glycosyltransferase involved in cell wall biosynthesis